jgi:hypothetical protein
MGVLRRAMSQDHEKEKTFQSNEQQDTHRHTGVKQ